MNKTSLSYIIMFLLSILLCYGKVSGSVGADGRNYAPDKESFAQVAEFETVKAANEFILSHEIYDVKKTDRLSGDRVFLIVPSSPDIRLDLSTAVVDEYGNVSEGEELLVKGEAGCSIMFSYTVPGLLPSIVVTAVDGVGRRSYWSPLYSGKDGSLITNEDFASMTTDSLALVRKIFYELPESLMHKGIQTLEQREEVWIDSPFSIQYVGFDRETASHEIWQMYIYTKTDGNVLIIIRQSKGVDWYPLFSDVTYEYDTSEESFKQVKRPIDQPVTFEALTDDSKLTSSQKASLNKYRTRIKGYYDKWRSTASSFDKDGFKISVDYCIPDGTLDDAGQKMLLALPVVERVWNGEAFVPVQAESASGAFSKDFSDIISCLWTDGSDYVEYLSPDVPEMMGVVNASKGENLYLFLGGNLHEGGTHFWMTEKDGSMYVADKEEYQMFPVGDRIKFDSNRESLLFRDAASGKLHGVLNALQKDRSLRELMVQDMLSLVLAGNYKDGKGADYHFSESECRAEGFPFASGEFSFGEEYEMPVCVIVFDEASYQVRKITDGLELVPVRLNQEDDFFEIVDGGDPIILLKVVDPAERPHPLVSERIMTSAQLLLYAGQNLVLIQEPDLKAAVQKRMDALGALRNEIFAAHGLIFKSQKWNDFFGSSDWYNPRSDDVTKSLSEAELVNVEHLRILEKMDSDWLKESVD